MDERARSFYFAHEDAFLIPVEHLSAAGISEAFAAELQRAGRADAPWIHAFDAAFRRYHQRAEALWSRAGRWWFPPRLQNVLVLRERTAIHPYFRALSWSAWTTYEEDFRPETSTPELGAALLLHAERLNVVDDPQRALVANLSYVLTLDQAARAELGEGCKRTRRPDGAAWRALGQALHWIDRLYHVRLRPQRLQTGERYVTHPEAGLEVREDLLERVAGLAQAFADAAQASVRAHYDLLGARATSEGTELLEWLRTAAPELLLVDAAGETLWDYAAAEDVSRLAPRLAGIPRLAAESLRADLELIHRRSRAFLDAVREPTQLPHCSEEVDQVGGTYLHHERDRIAYCVDEQSTWLPLREPAPPYQRLLLAARTVHEWGHLADEARLIRVASQDSAAYRQAHARLATAFSRVYAHAPPPLRQRAEGVVTRREGQEMGAALADFTLTRFPDFAANVVMRELLEPAELEAYVRVNVRTHREESLGPFELLARFVHEAQYLRLSRFLDDPLGYFLRNTACERLYVDTGLMSRDELMELLIAMQALCDTYTLDPARIDL